MDIVQTGEAVDEEKDFCLERFMEFAKKVTMRSPPTATGRITSTRARGCPWYTRTRRASTARWTRSSRS